MASTTFKLKYPITVDGKEIKEIKVRRLNVADLEETEDETSNIVKSRKLLARISDLAPDDLLKMDAADFNRISDEVSDFLE